MEEIKKKRGRPLGSKNKPKSNFQVSRRPDGSAVININFERQIDGAPINRPSGQGYIRWGAKNDYPSQLVELYINSVTHKSCVDFIVTSILGDGVDYDAMQSNDSELVPNYQYTFDTLIERIALDYVLFGTYSLQIIKNRDDKTFSFFHQPMAQVRYGEKNDDGVIESYFISQDWSQTGLYPPIELKSFSFQDIDEIKGGQAYLFVYNDYIPSINTYPIPNYISALKPIQTEIELQRYDLRSVINNFSASGILTLARVDDDDEKELLIQNITSMFTGVDNANSLIINFRQNDEEKPAEFVKIEKSGSDSVNLFEDCNNRIVEKIITAHKISSKALIGYNVETSMLGGEGNVLNVAYNLFNKTVANKLRRNIINVINRALAMNGVETKLILKPLQFNIVDMQDTSSNNSLVDDKDEDTEQATSTNKNKNLDE